MRALRVGMTEFGSNWIANNNLEIIQIFEIEGLEVGRTVVGLGR